MPIEHLADRANTSPDTLSGGTEHYPESRYESEVTRIQLRESLAREGGLRSHPNPRPEPLPVPRSQTTQERALDALTTLRPQHLPSPSPWRKIMIWTTKISTVALGWALVASLAACGMPQPYSQQYGASTTATTTPAPAQSYQQAFAQPTFAQPAYTQPYYVQPAYVPPGAPPIPVDQVSQSESANVRQGQCDRNLLATTANGAANQFVGGAAGPLIAGEIQTSMTPVDNGCVGLTLEYAQNNQPVTWQSPNNAARYQVTPVRAYVAPNGLNCREYTTTATFNGRSLRIDDTACRLPNGLWQLQS